MMSARIWSFAALLCVSSAGVVQAQSGGSASASVARLLPGEPEVGLRASGEIGFLGVLGHEIQLGRSGTRLDYVSDFAQSNLFLFARLEASVDIWREHIITFVYQPIDFVSQANLPRDVRIDELDIARGTAMRAHYGFPFYRIGWAYDVLPSPSEELAFGFGGQLRNANIEFERLDGMGYRARNNVGPVPLLRARGRFPLPADWFFAFEVDGFYAFIPGLNGSDNDVQGAILDAVVRLGFRFVPHAESFLTIRYLGGGAVGRGSPTATSDGFQRNWLHTLVISLGGTLDTRP